MTEPPATMRRVGTGTDGLDAILGGGLPKGHVHLIHGGPGTGKTTLGVQFLREGTRRGERVLYVTMLQTRHELEELFHGHGWPFEGIDLLELPEEMREAPIAEQSLFDTAETQLHDATEAILRALNHSKPQRIVLDSLGELALLVQSASELRRLVVKLKHLLVNEDRSTALLTTSDLTGEALAMAQTLVHGVIRLTREDQPYGPPRRRLEVTKMRAMDYAGGPHDLRIRTGGLTVFPRLDLVAQNRKSTWETLRSGSGELDTMLGGGLEEGTVSLILGSSGSGKSTLAATYVDAAARCGWRSAIFCFDERTEVFLRRSEGLGMDIGGYVGRGMVHLTRVGVGEISPGEFMHQVRQKVEQEQVRLVVIDSLSGYFAALPDERWQQTRQMHELLSYLSGAGVLTFLIVGIKGMFDEPATTVDATYFADTILVMRLFESRGQVRRSISVLKKRYGSHQKTIREIRVTGGGLELGDPLHDFSHVLTGFPKFEGDPGRLLRESTQTPPES